MRGAEPGSARRDQRPWEPMKSAPGRGGTTVTFLPLSGARGAGRRLGGPGPAAPRAPSRIWAPGKSCSRLRGGERPGAAPAPRLQPSSRGGRERAGGDAGRGQTAGGERAGRLPPPSVLPGEQKRLGCPFASPASPALLPGVPLTPGHPEAAPVRFQTNAWKLRARGGGPIEAGWHSSPVTSRLSSTSGCELSWPPARSQIRRPLLTLLCLPTAFENQVTNFLVAQFLLLCKWVLTASISPSGGEIR